MRKTLVFISLFFLFSINCYSAKIKELAQKSQTVDEKKIDITGYWKANYIYQFEERLTLFQDNGFAWAISGQAVDGLATGTYRIYNKNGQRYVSFYSSSQKGNISLLLNQSELFEIIKCTDSEFHIKPLREDDLFGHTPIRFSRNSITNNSNNSNVNKAKISVNDILPLINMINIPQRNFSMSKTEVTQKLYFSVMGENPSKFKADNKPVENVNLYDAIYFCNKLSEICGLRPCYKVNGSTDVSKWNYSPHIDEFIVGEIVCDNSANGYRLPTNEEWEYAAKCGKNYMYSGSDNPDDVAWYNGRSNEGPHVVATKKSNSFGLYDMSGNVDEWCWKFRSDKMPDSQSSVARGGNWGQSFLIPLSETSSVDISYGASYRSSGLGFRICRKQ